MTTALELAYLGVEVADPSGFGAFLTDVAGLVPGEPAAGMATFRNDDRAHRLLVIEGPRNDAAFVGFEADSDAVFAAVVERARAAGAAVREGTDTERAARRVEALAVVESPWGVPVEIVRGLAAASTPFASPLVPGGFLTEGQGFGHAVFVVGDLPAADAFVTGVLGLAQSDWIETDLGGLALTVRFYHCNARHHSLAIGALPFEVPQKLHHVMVEANRTDDVGLAFDRVWNADLPIANGLGKHDNDKMFSFYVVTPAGFQLEFGSGARSITQPWTEDRRYERISEWGHQPITH